MTGLLQVNEQDLKKLDSLNLVKWMNALIFADCFALNVDISKIQSTIKITVADGGVDACVEATKDTELLKEGINAIQFKTGNFQLTSNSELKNEVLTKVPKGQPRTIKPMIAKCLERKGSYTLVVNNSFTPEQIAEAEQVIIDCFAEHGFPEVSVRILAGENLAAIFNRYPSLCLQLKDLQQLPLECHELWGQNSEMRRKYESPPEFSTQATLIKENYNALGTQDGNIHLRLTDTPGSGKTRFIFESLKTEEISPLVLFCQKSKEFAEKCLPLIRNSVNLKMVLVIDECDKADAVHIWDTLRFCDSQILLISIYNMPDSLEYTDYLDIPRLQEENIQKILENYIGPIIDVDKWTKFVGDSPRFAHLVGYNLKKNSEDVTRDVRNIYDRILAGYEDIDPSELRKRQLVFQCCALFKRFGCQGAVKHEIKEIEALVQTRDHTISSNEFYSMIKRFQDLKVLQGNAYLYITPMALHTYMWKGFWIDAPNANVEDTLEKMSGSLQEAFFQMFDYVDLADSSHTDLLKKLIEKKSSERSTQARLIRSLARMKPDDALGYIKQLIADKSVNELLSFETGRRDIINSLAEIAEWYSHFDEASSLLLKLAEAENETWSNNATGVFQSLFWGGYGEIVKWEKSPSERLEFIKNELRNSNPSCQEILLEALRHALATSSRPRQVREDFRSNPPTPWQPQSRQEVQEAYYKYWEILTDSLSYLSDKPKEKALSITLGSVRGILGWVNLSDKIISDLSEFIQLYRLPRDEVVQVATDVIKYDSKRLPKEIIESWTTFKNSLYDQTFSSRLEKYMVEPHIETQLERGGLSEEDRYPELRELAQEGVIEPVLLENELNWLVTKKAKQAWFFGLYLADCDSSRVILSLMLTSYEAIADQSILNPMLLGGYLKGVHKTNIFEWENLLDSLALNKKLNSLLLDVTWRSGASDKAAKRVLSYLKVEKQPAWKLNLFSYASYTEQLSQNAFNEWIDFLLTQDDHDSVFTGLSLMGSYYHLGRSENLDITRSLKLLTHSSLLDKEYTRGGNANTMDEYYWSELAKAVIRNDSESLTLLTEFICKSVQENGFTRHIGFSSISSVLQEAIEKDSKVVWSIMTGYLEGEENWLRRMELTNWLCGESGLPFGEEATKFPILHISPPDIWQWIDANPETRACIMAKAVPKSIASESDLARQLLVRYGHYSDVGDCLAAHFNSESWSGPASEYFERKKAKFEECYKLEKASIVKTWIHRELKYMESRIKDAQFSEEQRGY